MQPCHRHEAQIVSAGGKPGCRRIERLGQEVGRIISAVEVRGGPNSPPSENTACHISVWSVRAAAMRYGRRAQDVLKPSIQSSTHRHELEQTARGEEDRLTKDRAVRAHSLQQHQSVQVDFVREAAAARAVVAKANCGAKFSLQMRCSSLTSKAVVVAGGGDRAVRGIDDIYRAWSWDREKRQCHHLFV